MLLSKEEREKRIGELRDIFRQIAELEEQAAAIIERSVCGTFVEVGMHIDGKEEPREDDEPAGGGRPKKKFGTKPCCGSQGPRHKAECPYGMRRNGSPAKDDDDLDDLKELHAWECIDCSKIVETRQEQLDVPCTSCKGQLVQKF